MCGHRSQTCCWKCEQPPDQVWAASLQKLRVLPESVLPPLAVNKISDKTVKSEVQFGSSLNEICQTIVCQSLFSFISQIHGRSCLSCSFATRHKFKSQQGTWMRSQVHLVGFRTRLFGFIGSRDVPCSSLVLEVADKRGFTMGMSRMSHLWTIPFPDNWSPKDERRWILQCTEQQTWVFSEFSCPKLSFS